MPTKVNHVSTAPITNQILAIRDSWRTKRHPFFRAFGESKLALKPLGRYQALHYHFVCYAVRSFGLFYTRFYQFEDVRMMAENLAEEEGFKAIPQPGHEPHDHAELIFRFRRAAGLSDEAVRSMKMPLLGGRAPSTTTIPSRPNRSESCWRCRARRKARCQG
jgi:pyrroloquinoline quinone (PQQ) biosynthesis protein C